MTKDLKSTPLCCRREFLHRSVAPGHDRIELPVVRDGMAMPTASGQLAGPKPPHHKPTAKSVIWCFMKADRATSICSIQTALVKLAGQPLPASFGRPITAMVRPATCDA